MGFTTYNGVLLNFVILLPMLQGVDWLRQKRFGRGLAALLLPLAWPVLISLGAGLLPLPGAAKLGLTLMGFTVLPMWNFINDGGLFFILTGLLLYLCRGAQAASGGNLCDFYHAGVVCAGVAAGERHGRTPWRHVYPIL